MYPHPIRLRGPWQCEVLADPAGQARQSAPVRQVAMPARWDALGLGEIQGRVRFLRRFGYPGQIDDDERVWLTLAGLAGPCAVWVNGTLLAETDTAPDWLEWDVTALLRPRNELRLERGIGPAAAQPWTEAALEVRCLAFLRGVQVEAIRGEDGLELEVRGEVVGAADRPLDLYVILDRLQAGYERVQPRPEGQPFLLRCRELPPQGARCVQIDLVKGATVWYTLTRQLA